MLSQQVSFTACPDVHPLQKAEHVPHVFFVGAVSTRGADYWLGGDELQHYSLVFGAAAAASRAAFSVWTAASSVAASVSFCLRFTFSRA